MYNLKAAPLLMALAISVAPVALSPVMAQSRRPRPNQQQAQTIIVPRGTQIQVMYDEAEKILLTKQESMNLTLMVAQSVTDRNGRVLIPYGSEIQGKLQPSGNGSRFVAQSLLVDGQKTISLNATSRVVSTTEVVEEGDNTSSILQGTLIGAAAATAIAAVTGDTAIATEEVLGGAGLGALAGWLLGMGGSTDEAELISINPEEDLTLVLRSDLSLRR